MTAKASGYGFLLGAGVSIPSGGPSGQQMTATLTSPDIPYVRATDERFYPRDKNPQILWPPSAPPMHKIATLIACLGEHVSSYYDCRFDAAGCLDRSVNYEDLAYLSVQLSEAINRERDNPALVPFVRSVEERIGVKDQDLRELADETVALINDHVRCALIDLSPCDHHLQCLIDGCRESQAMPVPVLSLNHDTLIERTFEREKVSLGDMMRARPDGRCVLDGAPLRSGATLYKLHGSIDWFRWRPRGLDRSERAGHEWYGAWRHAESTCVWDCDERPLILVGRFNKELSYANRPFCDLFSQARQALEGISTIVVSGYSFGDKAVNTMVVEWMESVPTGGRKLVIAHPDPDSVQRAARGAIANQWERWCRTGILISVPLFLGDLRWADLRRLVQ